MSIRGPSSFEPSERPRAVPPEGAGISEVEAELQRHLKAPLEGEATDLSLDGAVEEGTPNSVPVPAPQPATTETRRPLEGQLKGVVDLIQGRRSTQRWVPPTTSRPKPQPPSTRKTGEH